MEDVMEMLRDLLLGANALLFVALLLAFFTSSHGVSGSEAHAPSSPASHEASPRHALLVTAHPDDESMFFLPLLHSLTAPTATATRSDTDSSSQGAAWVVHLLCLSRGNADGLGDIRAQELLASGQFLGLAADRIHVVEDAALQDGMATHWAPDRVAHHVLRYMDQHNIRAVFTFDDYGVSGHPNHGAVSAGVALALRQQHMRCQAPATATTNKTDADADADADTDTDTAAADNDGASPPLARQDPARGWALESVSLLRKYTGVVDALLVTPLLAILPVRLSPVQQQQPEAVLLLRPWWNYRAMALHASQFVWYRRLFVVFSRYTFINTFTPLVPEDGENISSSSSSSSSSPPAKPKYE